MNTSQLRESLKELCCSIPLRWNPGTARQNPLIFGWPSPALKARKGWGHRQGVPKYVHMSSNESLHHCVCACVLQHTSAVESGSSASETVVSSPLLAAESSFEGEEGIISAFQTMSVVQGSVELASTDSTCSISVPITRLRSTLTPFGKGGTGLDDNPGSTL